MIMYRLSSLYRLPVYAILGLVVGCAAAPLQEMSDARQALRAAHEVNALQHAPRQLQRAEQRLSTAEKALNDREVSFDKTRDDAIAAKEEAIKARMIAVAIAAARNALHDANMLHVNALQAEEILQRALNAADKGAVHDAVRYARQAERLATEAITNTSSTP